MNRVTVGLYAKDTEQEFVDFMRGIAPESVEVVHIDRTQPVERQVIACAGVDMIVPFHARVPAEVLERSNGIRVLQLMGAGTDYLDKPALVRWGIAVAVSGGANSVAVAEHTIMLMLMVYRKAAHQVSDVRAGRWAARIRADYRIHEFHELAGKTVGIVAAGNVGKNVARRLQGWDCRLLYTDAVVLPREVEHQLNLTRVDLDELLRTADVITLHVPLMASTRGLIGRRQFETMKPSAILINASRGPVVDEKALYEALKSRRILGAGLDVTDPEPIPADNPLFQLDNVVITPHLAGYTIEWYLKGLTAAMENAGRMSRNESLLNLIDLNG
jgi:phosphoglycerate dehydrogenase-like enzyme